MDNKIGISFDFSSSVLHHGSARAGRESPSRGAHRWGRGISAFTPCRFLAGRTGDEEMGPRQWLQAFKPLSVKQMRKMALEELEQRVGCVRQ